MKKSLVMALASVLLLASAGAGQPLSPSDFEYLGAFAVDDDYSTGGNDWNAYGQRGMTFDASGDPGNSDAFPGSLWITGHDYEQDVFEIVIPTPATGISDFNQLPKTPLLTNPTQFTGGCGGATDWFAGIEVHGNSLWGSCAHWYNVSGEDLPDVMWRRNLSDLSNLQGPFHAGPVGVYGFHSNWQGMYMLSIPPDWAAAHLGGKTLATGMHRGAHGGQMGPTILAFDPENTSDGYPLLHYRQRDTAGDNCYVDKSKCDFPGYTACDMWFGAAWIRTPTTDAVLIAGKKYDGESDYQGGGWDCEPGFGEIIFYDPDDLAARVNGALEPWEVVPYETWRPTEMWNAGGEFRGIAFDPDNGYLYVIERYEGAIVHVYSTGGGSTEEHTLTVSQAGDGLGTVTSSPNGIHCGVDCQEIYDYGTLVDLTATPHSDSYFAGWSGSSDCADGTVTMTSGRSCTATFELGSIPTYSLDISISGTGDGVVTSAPSGIDCGADCEEDFAQGSVVQLTASPAADSYFASWSGDSDCSDGHLTLTADTACTATFSEIDPDLGLVAFYSLNEGSGTTVMDASGNGYNGTLVNGPQWTDGPAIDFDGQNDYLDVGTFDIYGNAVTLAVWLKADDLANCGTGDCRLISKAIGTAEDDHYFMLSTIQVGTSTRLRFRLKTAGVTTTLIATSGNLPEGEWVHAAAVYDGTNMRLYKDGQLVGSTGKSGSLSTNSSVAVWIGANPDSATDMPWDGIIDEVRFYDRPLSAEDIQALPPPSESGLFSDSFESGTTGAWFSSVP
ncbi:MAG: LamG-like jellyroll fold domain-containing protein [Thermoanaerobaculia bacterium]